MCDEQIKVENVGRTSSNVVVDYDNEIRELVRDKICVVNEFLHHYPVTSAL